MKVTIFGGTLPKPGEPDYNEAIRLGEILARSGHSVITGGYMGTMEAVSKGAAEAGGHVIGVTCAEIERWRSSKANPWVKEEWKCATLPERMVAMMDKCDAVLVLPGGVGTLAEIALLWNRMIIQAIHPRPLILIGPRLGRGLFRPLRRRGGLHPRALSFHAPVRPHHRRRRQPFGPPGLRTAAPTHNNREPHNS